VLLLFALFVYAFIWFRQPKKTEEVHISSIATVLTPDPISQSILSGIIDTETKTAQIFLLSEGGVIGEAERGKKDDHAFFQMKTQLPEIDREIFYYNVWLVRPLPYSFFSIGEMKTNEEGIFEIEWEGQKNQDISDYAQIVVTKQEYKGSSDPEKHIAEGEFGKSL